ncbi:MAG: type IV pilus assembly protein PilM [Phycisphaeraceae bacterium]|nr:type IV pilus assembly protein PilM [Phycisphaeraceae bacterium]
MSAPNAAWGIEIGADALKALRLERDGESVRVTDFVVIPHRKVLSTPDVDPNDTIRITLGQFISQRSLEGEHLVMSVPGHAAFARFAKLPPVEPKKVPDIVRFEAVQQIPFPIDQVEWDYQTFQSDDSPEIEVGIFAMTRDRVRQRLDLYSDVGLTPEAMTLSPVAVFNAMHFDLDLAKRSDPIVFVDIGTQATDVIVARGGRCWIRTFPLGGTHFTAAIESTFKLSYSKADRLKREASTSKYAKQILQAMRPVFSDLLQDLQRSLDYYRSVHRGHELSEMIGLGSTFRIPGLRKFIGQQLQINVGRLDEFRRISVGGREAAAFAEHSVNMATAYGCALQGVGLAAINANLVPVRVLRDQLWHQKTKWFAAASVLLVAGAASLLYHPMKDRAVLAPGTLPEVDRALRAGRQVSASLQEAIAGAGTSAKAQTAFHLLKDREFWPFVLRDSTDALVSARPQAALLEADPASILSIDPTRRRLVELEQLQHHYIPPAAGGKRRFRVEMQVRLTHADPVEFLTTTVAEWLRTNSEPSGDRAGVPYRIVPESVQVIRSSLTESRVADDGRIPEASRRPGDPTQPGGAPPIGRPGSPPGLPGGGPSPGGGGAGERRDRSGGGVAPPGGAFGGGGLGGPGGGDASGRRTGAPSGTRAPGSGGFPTGDGPWDAGASPPGAFDSPAGGAPADSGGATSGGPAKEFNLDAIAPIPDPAPILPPGARVFRVPIVFEIEFLDSVGGGGGGDETAEEQWDVRRPDAPLREERPA